METLQLLDISSFHKVKPLVFSLPAGDSGGSSQRARRRTGPLSIPPLLLPERFVGSPAASKKAAAGPSWPGFELSRRQSLKRVRSVVPCGGLEVPAHVRGVRSGWLEVPAHAREASNGGSGEAFVCWVAPDLVFFHAVGRSIWVQQHCGVGSCMAVTSWCGGVSPFCSSINAVTLQLFR